MTAAAELLAACQRLMSVRTETSQPGLRGVSLGNLLIKRVASTLSADLPHLQRFMTLCR